MVLKPDNGTLSSRSLERDRDHAEVVSGLQKALDALHTQLHQQHDAPEREAQAHSQTRSILEKENIMRHAAQQQAAGLQERLVENEAHRLSLEEKYTHARDALEHYRQSVKEQRDQDLRCHEQQLQQLQTELRQQQQAVVAKQEDATRLNQEGARLVSELSYAR